MAWNSQRIYLKPLSFECHSKRLHLRGVYYLTVYGNLKTVNIMANIRLQFLGSEKSETEKHKLECYANDKGEIYLSIDMDGFETSFISLDIPTSIKLAKTLRHEINYAKSEKDYIDKFNL